MDMRRRSFVVTLALALSLLTQANATPRNVVSDSVGAAEHESAAPAPASTQEGAQVRPVSYTPKRPSPRTPGTTSAEWNESARSDKFTGGTVERAALEEGAGGVEITVDVPAFRLTLWQQGREVKTYQIGVGMKKYPIVVGEREAREVIWNPSWIPPDSDWVRESGQKPGEVIKASDPRNPLGKVKIPLGGGYLIHQAKGFGDLGNLVSHGCVRMLQSDLYDLAEKLAAAHAWPVSQKRIARAKVTKNTVVAALPEPVRVDINYDTLVVERGRLNIYPDVYGRGTNTIARLRAELETSGVDASRLDDAALSAMLKRPAKGRKFVIAVASLERGSVEDGKLEPVITSPASKKPAPTKPATRRTRPVARG
ncbi:MAG TPA: L,D-transpeptidase [Pyrinomonadaceae bacterium]|nr:L,D-transpeptidase [Pyrinomonadaceae bacterium]